MSETEVDFFPYICRKNNDNKGLILTEIMKNNNLCTKKILFLMLCILASLNVGAQSNRTKKTETDGFVWYLISSTTKFNNGAEDQNGNTIIPLSQGYDWVYYTNGVFQVSKNLKYGICDKTGREIISPNRGYEEITYLNAAGYYSVVKGGKKGMCDLAGNEIISPNKGYDKYEEVKFNGTRYFKVEKNGKIGIIDLKGKEMVSTDRGYDMISYSATKNFYDVGKNGKVGFCDLSFNEIISPDRGYEKIMDVTSYGKHYYKVVKNGKYGACDLTGKEIVTPMYTDLTYLDDGFHCQDSNGKWYTIANAPTDLSAYASNTSSSGQNSSSNGTTSKSLNTSSSSSASRYGKLIKSGTFTVTGVMYSMGGYSSTGQPYLTSYQIYDNYIVDALGNAYPFHEMKTADGVNCRGYKCNNDRFYYYGEDGVLRLQEFMDVMGIRIGTVALIMPGDVRSAYTGASSSSTGSKSNTKTNNTNKSHKCKVCDGNGWIATENGASYGNKAPHWCKECQKWVEYTHRHEECKHCKGRGYW